MIKFDSNGNLYPPQIIEIGFDSFKTMFVDEFEGSQTRKEIFEQYVNYLNDLKEVFTKPFFQWINGSFVTRKVNPNDIDLVTFIDFETYFQNEKRVDEFRKNRYNKNNKIDGYFVKIYPDDHKNRDWYEMDKLQWLRTFDRAKNSKLTKGFLQINF